MNGSFDCGGGGAWGGGKLAGIGDAAREPAAEEMGLGGGAGGMLGS